METQDRIHVLTGKEGAEIDIKIANEWTKNHRERNPGHVISQFFGAEILNKILAQPGCVGLRFYYANSQPATGWGRFMNKMFAKNEGQVHLIIAGVNKDGTDQLPTGETHLEAYSLNVAGTASASASGTTTILGEQSVPCPGGVGCPQNSLTGA
jgi:hypothetical protein